MQTASGETLISCQDVALRFGPVQALARLSLQVRQGERIALVGANGCGKSSLLRLLHGLLPPSSGACQRQAGLRQAMLFQRPFMLRASVLHNVALALWLQRTPWAQACAQAVQALQRVRLQDLAGRQARGLSGGQQQRLALARAWSLRPDMLLLDEPTASLDPYAKREVEELMAELAAEGMTLVFASHNLGQVKRLATRVLYLERGQLLADLPVSDFFDQPVLARHAPAAALFVQGERV